MCETIFFFFKQILNFCFKNFNVDVSYLEIKLKNIMNTEIHKLPFLSEKFLSCCSNEGNYCCYALKLCIKLLFLSFFFIFSFFSCTPPQKKRKTDIIFVIFSALLSVMYMVERLVLDHGHKLNNNAE